MTIAQVEQAVLSDRYRWDARQKYREYRDAVASPEGTSLDVEMMHAYHQLGMGRKVISLNKAMEFAGCTAKGQPTLAVANATARTVWFVRDAGWIHDDRGDWKHPASSFVSDRSQNPAWRKPDARRRSKTGTFRFHRSLFPNATSREITAKVPAVPPSKRPKAELSNYVVLWEANWEEAPQDPYLLRRVTDDLFVVLAEWSLTNVERLVMDVATLQTHD